MLRTLALMLAASMAVSAQKVAEPEIPRFSARTQQLTVRPGRAPAWLNRNWNSGDFSILDQGQRRELAFLETIAVPLDLVILVNLDGMIASPQAEKLQQAMRSGFEQLQGDDRTGGISADVCIGERRGLIRRDEVAQGNFAIARAPGPSRPVQDPIGCAVRLLTGDETHRAKVILILTGGRAEPLSWRNHLKELLGAGITVYVCSVPTEEPERTSGYVVLPPPPLPTPPSSRFPPRRSPPTKQVASVPVAAVEDGLDALVAVTGGSRAALEQTPSLVDLFKEMKDAMLLGYYPPEKSGVHEVRVETNLTSPAGPLPQFRYQQEYIQ